MRTDVNAALKWKGNQSCWKSMAPCRMWYSTLVYEVSFDKCLRTGAKQEDLTLLTQIATTIHVLQSYPHTGPAWKSFCEL